MLQWLIRHLSKNDAPNSTRDIPHEQVAARAAAIWDRKGRPHGQDHQNWLEAEAELRAELTGGPDPLPHKSR